MKILYVRTVVQKSTKIEKRFAIHSCLPQCERKQREFVPRSNFQEIHSFLIPQRYRKQRRFVSRNNSKRFIHPSTLNVSGNNAD
jgi:hypothetical protein